MASNRYHLSGVETRMRSLVFTVCVVVLAGCHQAPEQTTWTPAAGNMGEAQPSDKSVSSSSKPDYSDTGKQAAWIEKGEQAIKAKLRDPDSAQFRKVEFHAGGGVPIVCGEVNANNGFGGKSGYQRFVAAGDAVDVLESDMKSPSELDPVWDKFCRN